MSKAEDKLRSQAERLRRKLAEAEAVVGQLKTSLARVEAKLTGGPSPETGLDLLWKAARPIARNRSSKIQCRTEWNRIPAHERPPVKTALDALTTWNRCEEWKKDGGAFIPGLHRWIKARQWENLPEVQDRNSSARYRTIPKPIADTPAENIATPEDFAAAFAEIFPKRINS